MSTPQNNQWVKELGFQNPEFLALANGTAAQPAESSEPHGNAGAAPVAMPTSMPAPPSGAFSHDGTDKDYLELLDQCKNFKMLPVKGKPVETAKLIGDITKQFNDNIAHTRRIISQIYPDARDFMAARRDTADLVKTGIDEANRYVKAASTFLQAQQFAFCHDAIIDALKNVQSAQMEIDKYTRKQTAMADLGATIATGVRDGCEKSLSALAPLLGPAAVALVETFNEALNDADDHFSGKPVNLGKSAAHIILSVVLAKFGKQFDEAIDAKLGPWIADHVGPLLKAGTKDVDVRFLTIYVRDKFKDGWSWLLENRAGSIYSSATGEKKPSMLDVCKEFLKDIESGKWFTEKGAEEAIQKLLEEAVEHAKLPKA